jgi:hypothetical protein
LWYDPIGFVEMPWPPSLEEILVRGRDALFERLAGMRPIERLAIPPELLANQKDPAQRFAAILAGRAAEADETTRQPAAEIEEVD